MIARCYALRSVYTKLFYIFFAKKSRWCIGEPATTPSITLQWCITVMSGSSHSSILSRVGSSDYLSHTFLSLGCQLTTSPKLARCESDGH